MNTYTKLKAFLLGVREFRSSLTTSYDEDEGNGYELLCCYDAGRELAHRVTLRYWD